MLLQQLLSLLAPPRTLQERHSKLQYVGRYQVGANVCTVNTHSRNALEFNLQHDAGNNQCFNSTGFIDSRQATESSYQHRCQNSGRAEDDLDGLAIFDTRVPAYSTHSSNIVSSE